MERILVLFFFVCLLVFFPVRKKSPVFSRGNDVQQEPTPAPLTGPLQCVTAPFPETLILTFIPTSWRARFIQIVVVSFPAGIHFSTVQQCSWSELSDFSLFLKASNRNYIKGGTKCSLNLLSYPFTLRGLQAVRLYQLIPLTESRQPGNCTLSNTIGYKCGATGHTSVLLSKAFTSGSGLKMPEMIEQRLHRLSFIIQYATVCSPGPWRKPKFSCDIHGSPSSFGGLMAATARVDDPRLIPEGWDDRRRTPTALTGFRPAWKLGHTPVSSRALGTAGLPHVYDDKPGPVWADRLSFGTAQIQIIHRHLWLTQAKCIRWVQPQKCWPSIQPCHFCSTFKLYNIM